MKTIQLLPTPWAALALAAACSSLPFSAQSQPAKAWLGHDRTRPLPPVVTPALASTQAQAGKAPSDAVVLFDGSDLSAWVALDGKPTKWVVKDGAMECVPGSGYVRTLQSFGDCQLHLEFATPAKAEGSSQGRGNSGLFFGGMRYEIQVLDSYENATYADGSCASIYNQYPPLVNASRPPGQWQSYDVLWTAPRFDRDGTLVSAPVVTLFHNGVLVHHNAELIGRTGWLIREGFVAHSERQPIALQDHGNPVRYRNIWVRELGRPGKPEFALADTVLNDYAGRYAMEGEQDVTLTRDGSNLILQFQGVRLTLFAESPTRFFAKTVDVQAEFAFQGSDKRITLTIGEDANGRRGKKIE